MISGEETSYDECEARGDQSAKERHKAAAKLKSIGRFKTG